MPGNRPFPTRSTQSAVRRGLSTAVVVALVIATVGVGSVGGTTDHGTPSPSAIATDNLTEETIVVTLSESGDATLTLAVPFDLTDSDQRQAFEEFRADMSSHPDLVDKYESRLRNVAAEVNEQTDREMQVSDARIEFSTDDATSAGTVSVTATWEGLAAVDGDQIHLSSPFDSGFAPDRTVVVEPPTGYKLVDATPGPTVDEDRAVWDSDQSLDGFTLTAEPADSEAQSDSTDEFGPGFGLLSVLLAIGAVLAAARLRQ
jgi:hypothetical protein